jgi:hypothetical protein
MNKIKKIFIFLSLFAAVGVTYTIVTLKSLPEVFDWDLDEEDEDEF